MDIMEYIEVIKLYDRNIKRSQSFLYKVLDLSEQKDSCHTIKDLEVKLTFQQIESDNCLIRLMKNEPFVEKLSYCVVRVPYLLLLELPNKYLPSNCTYVLLQSRCKICSL